MIRKSIDIQFLYTLFLNFPMCSSENYMKVKVHPNKPQTKSTRNELNAHLKPQMKWTRLKQKVYPSSSKNRLKKLKHGFGVFTLLRLQQLIDIIYPTNKISKDQNKTKRCNNICRFIQSFPIK